MKIEFLPSEQVSWQMKCWRSGHQSKQLPVSILIFSYIERKWLYWIKLADYSQFHRLSIHFSPGISLPLEMIGMYPRKMLCIALQVTEWISCSARKCHLLNIRDQLLIEIPTLLSDPSSLTPCSKMEVSSKYQWVDFIRLDYVC